MFSFPEVAFNAQIGTHWNADDLTVSMEIKWGCLHICNKKSIVLQNSTVEAGPNRSAIEICYQRKYLSIVLENEVEALRCLEIMLHCTNWSISDFYLVGPRLGNGSFGKVYKATRLATAEELTIKVMKTTQDKNEYDVLTMKQAHRNLLSANDVLIGERTSYVVTRLHDTDLYHLIRNKTIVFTEHTVRNVMRQILQGLAHLQEHCIAHCDIKTGNILCSVKDENVSVQICDFGTASFLDGRSYAHHARHVTTYQYSAPEQLDFGPYDGKADIFAAGSIMYELCTGRMAFPGRTAKAILRSVQSETRHIPENFSEEAHALFGELHRKDPKDRPTAVEALRHEWFQESIEITSCLQLGRAALFSFVSIWN